MVYGHQYPQQPLCSSRNSEAARDLLDPAIGHEPATVESNEKHAFDIQMLGVDIPSMNCRPPTASWDVSSRRSGTSLALSEWQVLARKLTASSGMHCRAACTQRHADPQILHPKLFWSAISTGP